MTGLSALQAVEQFGFPVKGNRRRTGDRYPARHFLPYRYIFQTLLYVLCVFKEPFRYYAVFRFCNNTASTA